MDRGALRIGGWGALAVAAVGVARLALAVAIHRSALQAFGPTPAQVSVVVLLGLAGALALGAAAYGARVALAPLTRLLRTVTVAGWLGAVATFGAAAAQALRNPSTPAAMGSAGLVLDYLSLFASVFWIVGVCAIDWRVRRLPAWVRVAGTASGVCALSAVVLPELGALALPFTLAFWMGLGGALLRLARSAEDQRT